MDEILSHEVLEAYLKSNSVVQHQIESYNKFIRTGMQKIINNQSIIEPEISGFAIKFTNIRIEPPIIIESDSSVRHILPNEARIRDLNYSAPLYLTYIPVISGIEKLDSASEVFIGELPVMVKSDLCYTKNMTREQLIDEGEDPDDPGGYFIVRGTERALIGLEDLAQNRIICNKEKSKDIVISKVFSTTLNFRAKCAVSRDNLGIFKITFPTINKGLNLILILRALGLQTNEIINSAPNEDIKNDLLLNIDVSDAKNMSPKEALLAIGAVSAPSQTKTFQEKRAEIQLDTYVLPHLGTTSATRKEKGFYILRMAAKASLVALGYIKADDKDHYANKRIKLAGDLMEELFNNAFKLLIKDIKHHVERTSARGRKLTIKSNINADTLTTKILYSISTGTWPGGQTGVSKVLDRVNFTSSISDLRRVKSPLAKKHPHYAARDVHGTHIGKLCPAETTEGLEVGLIRYLSIMSKVTTGIDDIYLLNKLKELKILKK
ncbi:MAG: DNA-directed RNA polymerase subunit B'' [Candidatus Marsarchaeota archaeon]|jgi:DNA-directed RNA polymerase subunit B"|nr:DNA-directed RNA polymerase subunit B'' [Candidatus Marsarchaeota archaeon]